MLIYPSLPLRFTKNTLSTIPNHQVWKDGTVRDGVSPTARTGMLEAIYCFKTSGFISGKVYKLNGFDVRRLSGSAAQMSGLLYRYNDPVPQVSYSGNPASWFCDQFANQAPSRISLNETEMLRVLVDALAKAKTPEADIGLMLAEVRETLQLLASPLKGIVKLMRKMHKRRKHFLSDDELSKRWLEYRYGICPLISDVISLQKLIAGKCIKLEGKVYKSSAREQVIDSSSVAWPTAARAIVNTAHWSEARITTKVKRHVNCHYYYRPSVNFTNMGSSIYDLPGLVWELIPYSFVVDWFVGIGDWLRAIQPTPNVQTVGTSIFSSHFVQEVYETFGSWNGSGTPWCPGYSSFTKDQYQGYRYIDLPPPNYPLVNTSVFNVRRTLDSLSLIWQKMPYLKSLTKR